MAVEALAPALQRRRPAFSFGRWLEREGVFSWLMVALPMLFLVALVGYPFFYGIWLSLQNRPVAKAGRVHRLDNFIADWHDRCSGTVVINTIVYTDRRDAPEDGRRARARPGDEPDFRFKNLTRALLLLPFIVADRAVDHRLAVDPRSPPSA
jgi:multiple sugar transport system permease protein